MTTDLIVGLGGGVLGSIVVTEPVDQLTERVDDVVPLIEADHPQTAAALRDANAAVKRAL